MPPERKKPARTAEPIKPAKLQVYLPPELFRQFKIHAATVGEPMSAIVERLVREHLKRVK